MSRYLLITAVVFIIDQLSKFWVTSGFELHAPWPVIQGVFNITHACNHGAAFSFLSEAGGWQRWLFSLFAAIVSIGIIIWLLKLPKNKSVLAVALAFILGGALGNLSDRFVFGCVVDFIQVYIPFIPLPIFNPWPTFNIADSAIFIGAILYIFDALFEQKEEQKF